MSRTVAPPRVVNIADLRRLAQRRLPRLAFDYIDGGADDEITLRENSLAFSRLTFRPRSAVATSAADLRTTVLGTPLDLPFLLAPVGSSRLFYPRGEVAAAKAAGAAGTAWYQVYLVGGRDIATAGIARAQAAGFSALVLTIDTAVAGQRERDVRNGVKELVSGTLWEKLPFVPQVLARPRWLAGFLADGGLMNFPNVVLPEGPMGYADVGAALAQSVVTWTDLRWIRDLWKGPIVIKGVHTGEDARQAIAAGAQALVVSNHGGRQLDGVPATLRVLPEVLEAVNGRVEVLIDGGIRRGGDVAKALCLGARAVLVGRAYAYGLGAAGGDGVARAIAILRADLIRTLKLLGCPSVAELDRSYLDVPADWL